MPKQATQTAHTSQKTEKEHLQELWIALKDAMLQQLKSEDEPKASFLNVVRQFLRDNGITLDSVSDPLQMQEAIELMASDLPSYEDEPWNQ